jgi:hypothetical protein
MAQNLKLNQILTTEKGAKNKAENTFTVIHQMLQKPNLLSGISRTYTPRKEGDEVFPPEVQKVQFKTEDRLRDLSAALVDLFDETARKDKTNCAALADVILEDGIVLASGVPATHLLFIEKKLGDLITFFRKLAVLDPAEDWQRDEAQGLWRTAPTKQFKTKKVTTWEPIVAATKEHPAQLKERTNDEVAGEWTTIKYSGALPAERVTELLNRTEKLLRAVKRARAAANNTPVVDLRTGDAVLGYIFK